MRHRASPRLWPLCETLTDQAKQRANKTYALLRTNRGHPSRHLKRIGKLWSARIDDNFCAVGLSDEPDGIYWIWIGAHADYDKLIKFKK